jgi:hypothetical protein
MQNQKITRFVNEFFFDDNFPGDYFNRKSYIKESIKGFDEILRDEFEIGFEDLDKASQETFKSNLEKEWEIYSEE